MNVHKSLSQRLKHSGSYGIAVNLYPAFAFHIIFAGNNYVPVGFDSETMNISGNTTSYGGDYQVVVTLKDTDNYEWEDGTASSYVFVWQVVGADTVFVAVVASLCVLTVVTGGIALIQFLGHKRRLSDLSVASETKEGGDE